MNNAHLFISLSSALALLTLPVGDMVLILDGNSQHVAHAWSMANKIEYACHHYWDNHVHDSPWRTGKLIQLYV